MRGLFKITGRATKCGPTSMAAVTGLPSHDCAAYIRKITGKRAVNGTSMFALTSAIELSGHDVITKKYEKKGSPTLRRWMPKIDQDGRYIIWVANHWIAYSNGRLADSGYFSAGHQC